MIVCEFITVDKGIKAHFYSVKSESVKSNVKLYSFRTAILTM